MNSEKKWTDEENDWYESQEFIELKAIIIDKDVMDLIEWKEKELI